MSDDLAAELAALKAAYRAGTRVVAYDGRRVEYDDEAGLRRRIAYIEAEMRAQAGVTRPVAGLVTFRGGRRV